MTIDPAGACTCLLESLGGDRLAGRGELEKLFLYVGDTKHVAIEDVEAIVGETTGARTDSVIDAALLGDNEALEAELGRLRAEGGSPAALGTLALRHLISCRRCVPRWTRGRRRRGVCSPPARRSSSDAAPASRRRCRGGRRMPSPTRAGASTARWR